MWDDVIGGGLVVVMIVLCFFAIYSWCDSRELWNNGVCLETGLPWLVIEINGNLYLENDQRFVRISGIVVYGGINAALREQQA